MHDQNGSGTFARSLLELVGPAAVIRHRLAPKRLRIEGGRVGGIRYRRIVDEDDDGFALDVDVLEVVPVELRRVDSVPGEDDVRACDGGGRRNPPRPGDDLVLPFQWQRLRALAERERLALRAGDPHQGYLLNVGTVGVARLEAKLLELCFEERDREIFAGCSRRAPLELVGRHLRGGLQDCGAVNCRQRREWNGRRRQRTVRRLRRGTGCWLRLSRLIPSTRSGQRGRRNGGGNQTSGAKHRHVSHCRASASPRRVETAGPRRKRNERITATRSPRVVHFA